MIRSGTTIFLEAGHGYGYRQTREMDLGHVGERYSEALVCSSYVGEWTEILRERGYSVRSMRRGSVTQRLRNAVRCDATVLVSLHMVMDPAAVPGGSVSWATKGSEPLAYAVGAALALPVLQAPLEGVLMFNPSIEIELGNLACWSQMKQLGCMAHCTGMLDKIAPLLVEWGRDRTQ